MNTSPFMDKQIMGLEDLMNPQVPSYDFEPIRTVGSSSSAVDLSSSTNLDEFARNSRGSVDSKIDSATRRYSNILEPHELAKVSHEKERDAHDVVTVAEVDRIVKKYADNLLHALEGVSSRVSQLEGRTRHLESSIDELKDTVGNNSGSTDGKLRQIENILREVQTGVQVLRDKQEIAEAHLQLTKLQQSSSKEDHYKPPSTESSNAIAAHAPSSQTSYQPGPPPPVVGPPPQQPHQFPTPNAPPQQPLPQFSATNAPPQQPLPQFSAPNAPPPAVPPPQPPLPQFPVPNAPPPSHQNLPPQFPTQLSQSQQPSVPSLPRESSYFPPPGAHPMQPQPQPQSQLPPQSQHYQLPQYSHQQMAPQHSLNPSSHLPSPLEESAPYMPPPPSQTYPPNVHPPAPLSQPPPSGGPPQYYGSGQLPFPSGPSFSDSYPYSGGSPSHYNSTMMNPSPFSNSPPSLSGVGRSNSSNSSNYSRLPTAKVLPQAVPIGPSSTSGNRVPVDDVVDKVATMGFSREQVRTTVRKLTENGQSVDLNVVLDKLMNGR